MLFVSSRAFLLSTHTFLLSTPEENSESTWKKATKCNKTNYCQCLQTFLFIEKKFQSNSPWSGEQDIGARNFWGRGDFCGMESFVFRRFIREWRPVFVTAASFFLSLLQQYELSRLPLLPLVPEKWFHFQLWIQKYSKLRCLLRVKGLVVCFYLGWSGSILQFRQNVIKVGSKS